MEHEGGLGAMSMQQAAPFYLCVHVPEFPAQARLRLRSELLHTPVAVLEGDPPLEQVCSANRKALTLGVTQGMTRTELDSFPELTTLRRSPEEERTTRSALLNMAGTFTPRVEVCAPSAAAASSFVFVLDMTGTGRIFGQPAEAARSVLKVVEALELRPRIAGSSNFHAAVCASAFAVRTPVLLAPGKERAALELMPLSGLVLTEEQRSTFALWGIGTLGELAALPEKELIVRLGQQGRRLWELARGEHPHLMVPEEPVFTLEERVEFDYPEDRLDSLLFVLGPMLDQLIAQAQAYALALASVTVRLSLDGGGEHVRVLNPALPLTERDVLLKLLQLDLQAHPPAAEVLAVHVCAEPGKRSKVQTGLFNPPLPEPMRLDVTLARIAALVGENRVGSPCLQDTHRPEGFTMERFVVPRGAPQPRRVQSSTARRCLRPPVPLKLHLCADTPAAFYFAGKRFTVAEVYGPWRRSGEWWSERIWSREEWDIRATAADGEILLCVILQDLLQKTWRLEALYD
jgi:protein ImuB